MGSESALIAASTRVTRVAPWATLGAAVVDPLSDMPEYSPDLKRKIEGFETTRSYVWKRELDLDALNAPNLTEAERDKIAAHPKESKELFPIWTMHRFGQMLTHRQLLLPAPEQAPDVQSELGSITETLKKSPQGFVTRQFGPAHPHMMSSFQCFVGALQQWELKREELHLPGSSIPSEAHAMLMLQPFSMF